MFLPPENGLAPIRTIPEVRWEDIRARVSKLWVLDEAPHHSIVSITGGGKSYLVTRGILSMATKDKVLIIDSKGGDPTLKGYGKPVLKLPRFGWSFRGQGPRDMWFQLMVREDHKEARAQVLKALERVWKEGDWIVVIDELKALTDPRKPGLGLGGEIEQMWTRGRSKRVGVIAGTQSPTWIPGSFKTQPSFIWVSRIEDEDAQKRLREIAGLQKWHLPTVSNLRKRQFLYVDNQEEAKYLALTKVV